MWTRRSELRRDLSDHDRITFLENDEDENTRQMAEFKDTLNSIRTLQMGILAALVTGAILFALNAIALVLTR